MSSKIPSASRPDSVGKVCCACGQPIPLLASVCSKCSSFQQDWKNRLRFASNVVGIASVAIAVATYCAATSPQIRRTFWWTDAARVLSFDESDFAIANEGDGDVFVSHASIVFKVEDGRAIKSRTLPIKVIARSGTIASGPTQGWDRPEHPEQETVVASISQAEWDVRLISASYKESCERLRVFSSNNPKYLMFVKMLGSDLRTATADASLFFYSPHSRSMSEVTFDAVGVVLTPPGGCPQAAPTVPSK